MNETIDQVHLNFSPESLWLLNICLGFIMFGVALTLEVSDFKRLWKRPKAPFVGVFSQFLLLPFLTFLLIWIIQPLPSIALGMIMVAACPGGNVSNFMSLLAKGNTALSISLTAIATVLAIFLTPFNVAFWGEMYPYTAPLLKEIHLSVWEMGKTVSLLLGLPLVLGMACAKWLPTFTEKITRPIHILSIFIFIAFVVIAFHKNFDFFLEYIHYVILIVLIHNGLALSSGYFLGKMMSLPNPDVRTITIETGIQNSGLGLILIFNFFDGLGGMAMVAAWWGIWHLIAGLTIAFFWSKKTRRNAVINN